MTAADPRVDPGDDPGESPGAEGDGDALVECVPNFSEGRRRDVVAAIVAAVGEAAPVRVLDWSLDPDHHRSVVTFAGEPAAVVEGAFHAIRVASLRIDMNRHAGAHPRMGAADVCPLVPLRGASVERCVRAARDLGRRVGAELSIPVYFYGEAALLPGRRALPDVRKSFERLRAAVPGDLALRPDEGPAALHATAGATAIGVRPFLIAFNVNLETEDVEVARAIAGTIRESAGGLPGIRALGLRLERAGCVQVSTNVCDPERTGLVRVYEEVERLAAGRGVAVRESELVGLAPRAALDADVAARVRLRSFDAARMVIEELL